MKPLHATFPVLGREELARLRHRTDQARFGGTAGTTTVGVSALATASVLLSAVPGILAFSHSHFD